MTHSMHAMRRPLAALALAAAALTLPPQTDAGGAEAETQAGTVAAKSPQPPAQRDPNRLWCGEHGVYEDECFICHPELANREGQTPDDDRAENGQADLPSAPTRDPNRLWCREHGVYEDECFICHPELANRKSETPDDSPSGVDQGHGGLQMGLWCNEHDVAEIECGICQPQLAAGLEPGQSLKIRLPSPASASKAGIRTGTPRMDAATAAIRVYCEARYNQNRLARVTPLTRGVIHSVQIDVGDNVVEGQLLVEIASSEVAEAKRDLLVAIVNERVQRLAFEREKHLVEKEISATQSFQQAEAEYLMAKLTVSSARQRLINLGFTHDEVQEVEDTQSSSSIVHLHAPFGGTLVARSAVVGEAAVPGEPLFTLADLDEMWLNLLIPESRLAGVTVGQPVEAAFATLPGVKATGRIDWISTSVSEPSRMVEARATVSNEHRTLRSNLFGEALIALSGDEPALAVPADAVQRFDRNPFVFVKLEEDLYELRRVRTGMEHGGRAQIIHGLRVDEPVVMSGSFVMMSEFLKSRLGAGCVHD